MGLLSADAETVQISCFPTDVWLKHTVSIQWVVVDKITTASSGEMIYKEKMGVIMNEPTLPWSCQAIEVRYKNCRDDVS